MGARGDDGGEVERVTGKHLDRAARQAQISQLIMTAGSAKAADLADQFGVSVMTIHRDLDELERRGVLRKSRGAATAQPSGMFEANVGYRRNAALTEKQAIAAAAAQRLEPGMTIIIDDSTTVLQMIPALAQFTPLKVATNFRAAIQELVGLDEIELMALGGDYDPQHDAFVGLMCQQAIESIRVDAAFLSTAAVAGRFTYHQEQRIVALKRAMINAASQRYLLLDHTKFGRIALHQLAPVADFDVIFTDDRTPPELVDELRQYARDVQVVGTS